MRENEPLRPTPSWRFDARGPIIDWRLLENDPKAFREAEKAMLARVRGGEYES